MIDAHTHVNFLGKNEKDFIEHLDNMGIEKACLLAWEAVDGQYYHYFQSLPTRVVVDTYKKYHDRIIPFCGTDPRIEDALQKVEDWVNLGCRGYGELKLRVCVDNPDLMRMYEHCGRLGLPVLIHFEDLLPGNRDWYNYNLERFERMLQEFPGTNFIGHSSGFWNQISNDDLGLTQCYPIGKVVPGGRTVRLLETYPNLYADISANSGLNALSRDKEFGVTFIKGHYKKIIYGSDCFTSAHLDFLRGLELGPVVFKAITNDNINGLLKTT